LPQSRLRKESPILAVQREHDAPAVTADGHGRLGLRLAGAKVIDLARHEGFLRTRRFLYDAAPMETTLLILKPDAVQRGLMGRIIGRFEDKGLQIAGCKMMVISPELAARHYESHQGKPFYDGLVKFMTSSPVLVFAVRGVGAIEVCRKMMGATFGSKAEAGTIRGDYGVSNSFNLIHGSDSPEAASRELGLFFETGELFEGDRAIDQWVYDLSGGAPE
jgi:nucleoside-diphosphate kinase